MLIIISSWLQKTFKALCSVQHENTEIRKEISALPKRPTDGNGLLLWSSCRNSSPYSTNWITWFVFSLLIHDILRSDIFLKGFHACVVAIFAIFLNSNAFFVKFPSFTQISVLYCLQKTLIKHMVFFQIVSLIADVVKGYICFFNFPAGNLIHYCRFCIKTINITNDISVYNALPCKKCAWRVSLRMKHDNCH